MDGNPSPTAKEVRDTQRQRCIDHDDTCSSDETNIKGTQLSPSELPSSEAPLQSIFEDTVQLENNSYSRSSAFTSPKKYTFPMEENTRDSMRPNASNTWGQRSLVGAGANPLSTVINTSGRHKYLIESTITTSPRGITTIHKAGEKDERSGSTEEPEYVTSYYHRNTLGTYGFESVLSEIHNRCKNNDSINRDLEKMLETKNRQLSENFALLEQSRQTISKVQTQFESVKQEKLILDGRLRELERDRHDFSEANQQINEEVSILKDNLRKANMETEKKANEIEKMSSNLSKVTLEKDTIMKESRSSLDDLRQKNSELVERLQKETQDADKLRISNKTLREQLEAKEEDIQSTRLQLHREEKIRKHIEKEHELVTMQGQTLMQQQAAIRLQYEEDIEELTSKLERQEAALQEKEEMVKVHLEQIKEQTRSSNQNVTLLTDNNNYLAEQLKNERETHSNQENKYQEIIKQLESQIDEITENEKKLQKTIQELNEQHTEFENRLTTNKEEIASSQVSLLKEIDRLNETLKKERTEWSQKESMLLEEKCLLLAKHSKSFDDYRHTAEKESIELKCRNVELEEKLDQRNATLSNMKDQIEKLTERENETNSAYEELKDRMQKLLDESQKTFAEKDNEIQQLSTSMVNLEHESKRNIEGQEKIISDLQKKIADLNDQRQELEDTCADLRSGLQEARKASDQVQSMRALLSRKESSKAILAAEQLRIEKEYSAALVDKDSEIYNLEQELKQLQQENRSLRKVKESTATTIAGIQVPEASFYSAQTNDPDKTGMAKKHSSTIILGAENQKLKTELKNIEMWWQRDINELQKRCTTQCSTMSEMERRMTSLELENTTLKKLSEDRSTQQILRSSAINSSKEFRQPSEAQETLLEQYKQELIMKENKIKQLEASLKMAKGDTTTALRLLETASEQERVVQEGLQEQLAKNEADMEEVKLNLLEAEHALSSQDSRALEQLLNKSTTQLDLLLENTKCAHTTASSSLEVSAEKQNSLIKLHQKFVQTLTQIQKDATLSSTQQRYQFEELQKYYEDQVSQLHDSLKNMLKAKSDEVLELEKRNTQLMAMLSKAKEDATKSTHEMEQERSKTILAQNALKISEKRLHEYEQAAAQLRNTIQEQTTKLNMADTNASLDKDQSLTKLKIHYEDFIGKESESHKKELQAVTNRLRVSETENTTLQEQLSKLQTELRNGSKDLELEVQELHGKVHSLVSEKSALKDRFNNSLESLRVETELTLKEKSQQIHRQNCQISELEAKCKSLFDETIRGKESHAKLQKTFQNQARAHLDEVNMLKMHIQRYEANAKDLSERKSADEKQIAQLLEELTKREIEYVKQNNTLKQLLENNQKNEKGYETVIEKLKQDLKNKIAQLKHANNNLKQLKVALKSSEHELQLAEERLLLIKTDLKHVESISNMYKSEARNLTSAADSRVNKNIQPYQRAQNTDEEGYIHLIEQVSSGGLGCKVAELANGLTLKAKELEAQETRVKEYVDKNINLTEKAATLSRQKEQLEAMIHTMKQEADSLQKQLQQQLKDNALLKEDQARSIEGMTTLQRQLNEKSRETEALQRKLSSTRLLHIESNQERQKFDDLSRNTSQLRQKFESERESFLMTEKKLRLQAATMSKESLSLRAQLDEAFQKNQGLERCIKHLKRSYGQLFDDTEYTINYTRYSTGSTRYDTNDPSRRQSDI